MARRSLGPPSSQLAGAGAELDGSMQISVAARQWRYWLRCAGCQPRTHIGGCLTGLKSIWAIGSSLIGCVVDVQRQSRAESIRTFEVCVAK